MLNILQLLIKIFMCLLLVSCNNKNMLPVSGVYGNCVYVYVKNEYNLIINGIEIKRTGNVELCNTSKVSLIDSSGNSINRYYFFDKDFSDSTVIDDATTLLYNKPSFYHYSGLHDRLYITYIDSSGNVMVRYYDYGVKYLSTPTIVHSFDVPDDHSAPSITVTKDGRIILIFSHHSSQLIKAVSLHSEKIDIFQYEILTDGYNTYPSIVSNNNKSTVFFRKGFSGDNSKGEFHYIDFNISNNADVISKQIISFDNRYIIYSLPPKLLKGELVIVFSAFDRQDSLFKNIFYSKSTDNGATWLSKDGYVTTLNESNSILISEISNFRVIDFAYIENNLLISISQFENEYHCCNGKSHLSFINVNTSERTSIDSGMINYYSDGAVFDSFDNRVFYYIKTIDTISFLVVNEILLVNKTVVVNKIGEIKLNQLSGHISSWGLDKLGQISFLNIKYYDTYQVFRTNIEIINL